jgi:hypothetical protein
MRGLPEAILLTAILNQRHLRGNFLPLFYADFIVFFIADGKAGSGRGRRMAGCSAGDGSGPAGCLSVSTGLGARRRDRASVIIGACTGKPILFWYYSGEIIHWQAAGLFRTIVAASAKDHA